MPNTDLFPFASGLSVFAQGQLWPIGLVEFDLFEARILVPDTLSLTRYDRIAIKIGLMPGFPASVQMSDGDLVELEFLGSAHPEVVAQWNRINGPASPRLEQRGRMAA